MGLVLVEVGDNETGVLNIYPFNMKFIENQIGYMNCVCLLNNCKIATIFVPSNESS